MGILNPGHYQWSNWSIPPLIACIYFLFLFFLILIKKARAGVNPGFLIVFFTSFIWLFSYAVAFSTRHYETALFWCRNAYFGINFIAVSLYHFIIEVLGLKKQRKWAYLFYALMIAFIPVTRTDLFLRGAIRWYWGYYPYRANIIYDIFILSFCFYWSLALFNLIREYRKETSGLRKSQLKLLIIAIFVVTLAFVDFAAKYIVEVYPWGYLPVAVFLSLLFYSIVRYRFMEIETVVHQTLLWILTIILLVLPVGVLYGFFFKKVFHRGFPAVTAFVTGTLVFFLAYYRKLKPGIDHFFRRRKYDYYRVLSELPSRVGGSLDIRLFSEALFRELNNILYVRNGLLFIKEQESGDFGQAFAYGYERVQETASVRPERIRIVENDPLLLYLVEAQSVLEREQVELNPDYRFLKKEALDFFGKTALELLIPLCMGNAVVALLGIGRKENLRSYTLRDIELLAHLGMQIGITVDNALHHKDIVDRERLAEEMRLGREIQQTLLPRRMPLISGLKVFGFTQPAREIGGDYFDFIETARTPAGGKNSTIDIAIGDVAGKGVSAGLLMAMAKTAIFAISHRKMSPRDVLIQTNQVLNRHITGDKFMTMLYLRWDAALRRLMYSGAGHESLILYRGKKGLEVIPSGGMILGIMPDISSHLENRELEINAGDKIILYTDGVTEARNSKQELFGQKRLTDLVERYGALPADQFLGSVKNEIFRFMGERDQYDDITLVVMEASEAGAE